MKRDRIYLFHCTMSSSGLLLGTGCVTGTVIGLWYLPVPPSLRTVNAPALAGSATMDFRLTAAMLMFERSCAARRY